MFRSYLETPIGFVLIEATDSHITGCAFVDEPGEEETNETVTRAKEQLSQYFLGNREVFDVPLQPKGTPFQQRVWSEVMRISFGTTRSYLNLTKKLGNIQAIRAVAGANAKNPLAVFIPCHRVIGSDGLLTGYAWGLEKKEWLLQHEGAIQPKLF